MAKAAKDFIPVGLLISRASMQSAFQKEKEEEEEEESRRRFAAGIPESTVDVQTQATKDPLDVGIDAARTGDIKHLKQLLESGWPVSTPDKYGGTALHWAAGGGHLSCCKVPKHKYFVRWNRLALIHFLHCTRSFSLNGVQIRNQD